MKLSRASVYALYGLTYIAGQAEHRYVPLSEIRERCGVPEKHVAKIFLVLIRSGILRSARGVNGGFALAKPANQISVLDVVRAIEGPVDAAGCLLLQQGCTTYRACAINGVWRRAQEAMLAVLREATLANMVEEVKPPAPLYLAKLGRKPREPTEPNVDQN